MAKQNKTIALFSGPSGGHLFPAFACADALKEKDSAVEIVFFTSEKTQELPFQLPSHLFSKIIYLPNFPSAQGISLKSVVFLLKLSQAFALSFFYLIKIKPDVSVGFGSYASFPGMLVSHWLRIPTLIHEQNVVPGKANEKLARVMDCVAVTFQETFSSWKLKNLVLTGLPLRKQIVQAVRQRAEKKSDKLEILVVGGSQGARKINEIFLEILKKIAIEKRKQIAVNHITGETDFKSVQVQYETLEVDVKVHRFFEKIEVLFEKADLVISRAGANALSEIAAFELPALVVPYPHANAHQKANVEAFVAKEAMLICEESELSTGRFEELLRQLLENEVIRARLESNLKRFARIDGSEKLANIVFQLIKENK